MDQPGGHQTDTRRSLTAVTDRDVTGSFPGFRRAGLVAGTPTAQRYGRRQYIAIFIYTGDVATAVPLVPRLVACLRMYDRRTAAADVIAGVTVGLVALPLAMAFAIASGLTPQAGIYCAIVTGFIISALGGSRVQIGGPTGAFVVVVAGIIASYGVDGLFMCTLMAGVMLMIMGADRHRAPR